MNIQVVRGVRLDFDQACQQYSGAEGDVIEDFRAEVASAFREIASHPQRWPKLEKDVRRFLLKRFPYGILYQILNEHVLILAIMHLSRRPGYWRPRLKKK